MTAMQTGGKITARILRFLDKMGGSAVENFVDPTQISLQSDGRAIRISAQALRDMRSRGLLKKFGDQWRITQAGRAHLRRLLDPEDGFSAQHGQQIPADRKTGLPKRNLGESPLDRLFCGRGSKRRNWIGTAQYDAGERLRRDFEQAELQPRITQSWTSTAGSGGAKPSDLTDFALDARRRLSRAMSSLPPALAETALDVCCFLKGLEQVERERGWPPRSAKVTLSIALTSLAEHYGFAGRQRTDGKILHWGDDDYRPSLQR